MNSGYEQPVGPTVFMISVLNMSSNIIKLYMDGFYTQRDFHRVQEHKKRSSDEEVMTIRSWRFEGVQRLCNCVETHRIVYPRASILSPATQYHATACQRDPWQLWYTPF